MRKLILVLLVGATMSLVGCQYWRGGRSSDLAADSTNSVPLDRGGHATGGTGPGGSTVGGTGSAPER